MDIQFTSYLHILIEWNLILNNTAVFQCFPWCLYRHLTCETLQDVPDEVICFHWSLSRYTSTPPANTLLQHSAPAATCLLISSTVTAWAFRTNLPWFSRDFASNLIPLCHNVILCLFCHQWHFCKSAVAAIDGRCVKYSIYAYTVCTLTEIDPKNEDLPQAHLTRRSRSS